jgi:alanyl-tRNA synthetase
MQSRQIRQLFTEFFAERGHFAVPSSSLIPHNDPTVLLTTAGMQQMTPYFLGLEHPPALRMTSIQKCFRAVGKADDVMEVGDDTHLTFFEMLGNFSVGDYFKDGAIDLAWDLITNHFGIKPEQLWVTVNPDDDYSRQYWHTKVGVPLRKIQDDPGNIWGPVGESGPCGPNTEIYFDLDYNERGDDGLGPMSADEHRYVEFWNLVFMEFFQEPDGSRRQLERQNVDTGMGLERISLVLQGVRSIYDTDLFLPIITRAAEIAGVQYGASLQSDHALRIIGDHGRGVTFLVADGVRPGNEGRGYVLRRLFRRAVQQGRSIGIEQPFMTRIADIVIERFSEQYPELARNRQAIHRVIEHEEEAFRRTLAGGLNRFESLIDQLERAGVNQIPGDEAFRLHDTYGFPIDLTRELAARSGLEVDLDGFRTALTAQRNRSRAQLEQFADESRRRAPLYAAVGGGTSRFLGYDQEIADTRIAAILGDATQESAEQGDALELVLAETPFYGESGGQVGDTGLITTETGSFQVTDTQRPSPELVIHRGEVVDGYIEVGQTARAEVDHARRQAIRRNHTATHLLHKALRIALGDETHQAGSLVAPDRLRFDFTSLQPLGQEGVELVTALANAEVLADEPVQVEFTDYPQAIERGAMALFGEKYGDIVRVVEVPGYSIELCGGTHVTRTGEIGPIVVLSEASIGSGIRRIEALTGNAALDYLTGLHRQATVLARDLRVAVEDIPNEVAALQRALRERDRRLEQLQLQLATSDIDTLLGRAQPVDGTRLLVTRIDADDRDTLLRVGDRLRDRLQSGVIVLGASIDERPALLAMVTSDQTGRGLHAGKIIQELAPLVGGRGGGRPELAQGGGTEIAKLDDALAAAPDVVARMVNG